MEENGLISKLRLISKFITLQSGQQIITLHTFLNISRSKGNHAMKIGQLVVCNMKNSFFEKSHTKCLNKLLPDSFLENEN